MSSKEGIRFLSEVLPKHMSIPPGHQDGSCYVPPRSLFHDPIQEMDLPWTSKTFLSSMSEAEIDGLGHRKNATVVAHKSQVTPHQHGTTPNHLVVKDNGLLRINSQTSMWSLWGQYGCLSWVDSARSTTQAGSSRRVLGSGNFWNRGSVFLVKCVWLKRQDPRACRFSLS